MVSESGLHARPANELLKAAQQYKSKVQIATDNRLFNAKSLLGILGAGVDCGMEIEIVCTGEDEEKACREIVALIQAGLGE